ncbi:MULTISPECIES: hypothetical protein [Streptomyces]|uniref:Uncharacterized protein n=1 Tax=Streptomyces fimbriatus TaxID=68197 RepID=A0ABW0DFH6_STRFI
MPRPADGWAAGKSPKAAWRAGALGRRVKGTGVGFVFRPQPAIHLLRALGDDETRRMIEATHEQAIGRVPEWIGVQVAVIRFGKNGAVHDDYADPSGEVKDPERVGYLHARWYADAVAHNAVPARWTPPGAWSPVGQESRFRRRKSGQIRVQGCFGPLISEIGRPW